MPRKSPAAHQRAPAQAASLVQFVIAAIDEVAPGRGEETYWRGFRRWTEHHRQRHDAVSGLPPRLQLRQRPRSKV